MSAKKTTREDRYELLNDIRGQVLSVLEQVSGLIKKINKEPIIPSTNPRDTHRRLQGHLATLKEEKDRIEEGMFNVLILGEFSAGKTTMLNAMLEEQFLPTKVNATTALITVLKAPKEGETVYQEVILHKSKNNQKSVESVNIDRFMREYQFQRKDQNKINKKIPIPISRFSNVTKAEIEWDFELCRRGLRLIDSPGLGKNEHHTKVAIDALSDCQVVIFVFNATRPLSDVERPVIETLLESYGVNHVFFVVNKMDGVPKEEVEEVEETYNEHFKPYFNEGGFDQAFYDRRVFFICAQDALEARISEPTNEEKLKDSVLPKLEHALESFVQEKESVTAAFKKTSELLKKIQSDVDDQIKRKKASLDKLMTGLEEQEQEALEKLEKLEREKREKEDWVNHFGKQIASKIYQESQGNTEKNSSQKDSQDLIHLDEVSTSLVAQAVFLPSVHRTLADMIKNQAHRSREAKFQEWHNGIPAIVELHLNDMKNTLSTQWPDFNLNKSISSFLSGKTIQRAIYFPSEHDVASIEIYNNAERMGLIALPVIGVAGILMGWPFDSLIMPLALIVVIILIIAVGSHVIKTRVKDRMSEMLEQYNPREVAKQEKAIGDNIEQQFTALAKEITSPLEEPIEQARNETEGISRQKEETSALVEQEKERLHKIYRGLKQSVSSVSIKQIERLVESKST